MPAERMPMGTASICGTTGLDATRAAGPAIGGNSERQPKAVIESKREGSSPHGEDGPRLEAAICNTP